MDAFYVSLMVLANMGIAGLVLVAALFSIAAFVIGVRAMLTRRK